LAWPLPEIVQFLDRFLQIGSFHDASENGLQVENSGTVNKAGLAVDACLESILTAAREGCDLLVVHHGLFWGASLPVRGNHYRRLRALLRADMALYAAHLPLDAHPEVGNNARIADRLGLDQREPFARYRDAHLGVQGVFPSPLSWDQALAKCRREVGAETLLLRFGPERISRVGIISGSATDPSLVQEAADAGIDLLITGEPKQAAYYLAQEHGLNVFYGGHYRTETFGVQALGDRLTEMTGLPSTFIETACPL